MIFVDTSVWVAYLRHGQRSVVETLDELLDREEVALAAPVRLELLSGTSQRSYRQLAGLLNAVPVFFPSKDTFALAERWLDTSRRRGQLFGAIDLIIAATAVERGGRVWSHDDDFRRLAQLGLLKLFSAPGSS